MTIDGVEFDGITFKDQLALAKQRNFAAIRKQVGYKLTALLLYRAEVPNAARVSGVAKGVGRRREREPDKPAEQPNVWTDKRTEVGLRGKASSV